MQEALPLAHSEAFSLLLQDCGIILRAKTLEGCWGGGVRTKHFTCSILMPLVGLAQCRLNTLIMPGINVCLG